MAETEDAAALLSVALQDLYAGEMLAAERLPALVAHASHPDLVEVLERTRHRCAQQADTLAATGRATGGPDNLWMRGIMDDADRDTQSVAAGPLLDAAMIGAVRKMLAAKTVSYETAIGLAERLDDPALAIMLVRCGNEDVASDDRFAALLETCTAQTLA